ncbi:BNR repeat-like domain-containing protein [Daejeonella rubra]|uniref:exo-alpha-sialidase n=1 Tax=Daejeonella rubra TaxID=990371 RepID=A0A1G9LNV8_9SPHI|nr:sialidase family protein [Daejeonella rubra]SDL63451.1 BNR repeat-like domain-containing protein [Daejeonella rubra]
MKIFNILIINSLLICLFLFNSIVNSLASTPAGYGNQFNFVVAKWTPFQLLVDSIPGISKEKDILIYKNPDFYVAFPSIIKRPNGEFLLAFRSAPDRKIFGEKSSSHVDPNSYLVSLRSKDGENWTKEPDLLYAHPFGGSQDPCLLQLRNGTILCASYGWAFLRPEGMKNLKTPHFIAGEAVFLGGYLVRSRDGGRKWEGPHYPLHIEPEININPMGKPVPAYNRGALVEGKSGRIFWAAAASDAPGKTSVHLISSDDKGLTWNYSSPVAVDEKISFNETSVYETPKGDLVAFLRTAGFGDQACIARSTDGGKTFSKWESMGFKGHPMNALRLPDNRVLITYGYRHKPYGIRARILNAECTDFATAPEVILREDGGNGDIGYTWPVQLDKKRVLVVYYFNTDNGTRSIEGTILNIK